MEDLVASNDEIISRKSFISIIQEKNFTKLANDIWKENSKNYDKIVAQQVKSSLAFKVKVRYNASPANSNRHSPIKNLIESNISSPTKSKKGDRPT